MQVISLLIFSTLCYLTKSSLYTSYGINLLEAKKYKEIKNKDPEYSTEGENKTAKFVLKNNMSKKNITFVKKDKYWYIAN